MKRVGRGVLAVCLLVAGSALTVNAASFSSSNFKINGNLGDSIAGRQTSTNYQLVSAGGESIVGNGASGSYRLGYGYTPTLEQSLQLNVQPSGLVGYWSFDQGNGKTIVDESVNNTNAVMTGSPTFTSGKIGQAVTGFSVSDNLQASNDSTFNVSALTACSWIRLDSTSTNPIAFARASGTPNADGQWSIGFNGGTLPKARMRMGGANVVLDSPTSVSLGAWTHLCITYEGSRFVLYQNGVEAASQALSGSMTSYSRDVSIGVAGTSSQPIDGAVDESKIFSRALSAAEIKAEYDASNSGIPAGVSLSSLLPGTSNLAGFDSIIQTDAPGYTLGINQNNNLTSGGNSIPAVSGTIGSPLTWVEGTTKGLGFTLHGTNATALPGSWASGNAYAALPGSPTSFYTRSGLNGGAKDYVNMRLRVDIVGSQAIGNYTNQMTITGTIVP